MKVLILVSSDLVVDVDDFCLYMEADPDTFDETRGELILRKAQSLCESFVSPLPTGADAVVLDVATRAWVNPTNAQTEQEGTGPFSGSKSFGAGSGGLWLTRQNKSTLRRLVGGGGAFSIDMVPTTAGSGLPWWDTGNPFGYEGFDTVR